MRIDGAGNVGIGTASPNAKLTVVGNSIFTVADSAYATAFNATSGNVRILPYFSTYGGSAIIAYGAGYAGTGPLVIESSSTRFRAGGSERMRITSTGLVGIGTAAPASTLDVVGSISSTSTISAGGGIFIGNDSSYLYDSGTAAVSLRLGSSGPYGSFLSDSGTFMLDGPSGTLALGTAGVRRAVFSSAGNFGIGTSSPSTFRTKVLEVADTNNAGIVVNGDATNAYASLRLTNSGTSGWDLNYNFPNAGDLGFFDIGAADTRMTITSTGNVGVGLSAPTAKFVVAGGGAAIQGNGFPTTGAGWEFYTDTTTGSWAQSYSRTSSAWLDANWNALTHKYSTSGAERMRITSGGNVGIGTTGPAYQLQLSTDSAAKPSTNTWTIASDARIKTETGEYTKGLDAVLALRPVTYRYNGKAGMVDDGEDKISIIAQEAVNAFPECVGSYMTKLNEEDEDETEVLNWNGHALTFALVNSIKELTARLEALENN
jgi:hypothetical protein